MDRLEVIKKCPVCNNNNDHTKWLINEIETLRKAAHADQVVDSAVAAGVCRMAHHHRECTLSTMGRTSQARLRPTTRRQQRREGPEMTKVTIELTDEQIEQLMPVIEAAYEAERSGKSGMILVQLWAPYAVFVLVPNENALQIQELASIERGDHARRLGDFHNDD